MLLLSLRCEIVVELGLPEILRTISQILFMGVLELNFETYDCQLVRFECRMVLRALARIIL